VTEPEFKRIYNEYGQRLYGFIIWLTHNRTVSDDILQNVFVNIWKSRTVPSSEIELQRWLFTVARNAALDHFRKYTRYSRFRTYYQNEYYEPPADPDAHFTWNELSELPEKERSILYLHLKIGYTYKEIGEVMEISENLVRVRAFRALRKLREKLTRKEI
jgi:RNA polymerase sigma-70 factor (ECF subfamily)